MVTQEHNVPENIYIYTYMIGEVLILYTILYKMGVIDKKKLSWRDSSATRIIAEKLKRGGENSLPITTRISTI